MKETNRIYLRVFIIILPLISLLFLVFPGDMMLSNEDSANIYLSIDSEWQEDSNWHTGDDQSTAQVDLTYTEEFAEDKNCVYQWTKFSYKDTADTELAFRFTCRFENGDGVDFDQEKVNDWSELDGIEPTLTTDTPIPAEANVGTIFHSERVFNGFSIYNGTADELTFLNKDFGDYSRIEPNKEAIAEIRFDQCPIRIGEVELEEEPYTAEDGRALTESIATFDVDIQATIGNSTDFSEITVQMSFEVKHTVDYTKYKYGIDVDWTDSKDFITGGNINHGDSYCLVSDDRVQMTYYEPEQTGLTKFNSNNENDTAYFEKNDYKLAQFEFTKEFTNKQNGATQDTIRKYFEEAEVDDNGDISSRIFVLYDGFQYNISTGLEFDPTFTVYLAGTLDTFTIMIVILLIGGVALIGVGGALFYRKKHRNKLLTIEGENKD